jgi:hypothetical protein
MPTLQQNCQTGFLKESKLFDLHDRPFGLENSWT